MKRFLLSVLLLLALAIALTVAVFGYVQYKILQAENVTPVDFEIHAGESVISPNVPRP